MDADPTGQLRARQRVVELWTLNTARYARALHLFLLVLLPTNQFMAPVFTKSLPAGRPTKQSAARCQSGNARMQQHHKMKASEASWLAAVWRRSGKQSSAWQVMKAAQESHLGPPIHACLP